MKKLLFAAYSLNIGGIEKALVTLANKLNDRGYDVTIVLEKKEGIFLEELNDKINIIEYTPNKSRNVLKRKLINLLKRIKFIAKYKNKYDFSASYATYSNSSSFVSRMASQNNCLWVHSDYLSLCNGNIQEMKKFFEEKKYNKFKKIVFVSDNARENFLKVFPELQEKTYSINNLIDANKIKKQSEEKIEYEKEEAIITFVNIGRHSEIEKKLTRLFDASKKLKEEGYKLKVLLIGDGPDTQYYKQIVNDMVLNDTIVFIGRKQNPYPYFRIADCIVLTSDYEGYPVVFLESFVLNKPIITTKVSDYEQVDGKYGYVTEKTVDDVYDKMKKFIQNGFQIKETFDSKKYNNDIVEKIEKLF